MPPALLDALLSVTGALRHITWHNYHASHLSFRLLHRVACYEWMYALMLCATTLTNTLPDNNSQAGGWSPGSQGSPSTAVRFFAFASCPPHPSLSEIAGSSVLAPGHPRASPESHPNAL